MHTYSKDSAGVFTVGVFRLLPALGGAPVASHEFCPMMSFRTEESAARMVNYLNGGTGHAFDSVLDKVTS